VVEFALVGLVFLQIGTFNLELHVIPEVGLEHLDLLDQVLAFDQLFNSVVEVLVSEFLPGDSDHGVQVLLVK